MTEKEQIEFRLMRLQRALPYCKGRATDVKLLVEQEIRDLETELRKLKDDSK